MKICKIFSVLFFLLYSFTFGQKSIYITDNITKLGISNVNITINNNSNFTTDINGFVKLPKLNFNDSVFVSHVSYQKATFVFGTILSIDTLLIIHKDYVVKEITVLGDSINSNNQKISVNIDNTKKSLYTTTGDLLKNETLLFVKDYGGYSGVKGVSFRGLGSENTIVLFNEARVNDLRTGMFDFSLISPLSINKIEVYKNSDIENSYITPGGVVKLISGNANNENNVTVGVKLNTDLLHSGFFNLQNSFANLSYSVNFERAYSSNNYKYSFQDKDYKRQNSFFSKTFISSNIEYRGNKNILKLYSHFSSLSNGIPGFVVTNNTNSSVASNYSKVLLAVLSNDYQINTNFSLLSLLSYNNQSLILNDPKGQIFSNKTHQQSKLNDAALKLRLKYNTDNLFMNFGYEYFFSNLKNDLPVEENIFLTLNKNSHKIFGGGSFAISSPIDYINSVIVSGATSYEYFNEKIILSNKEEFLSYRASLAVSPQFIDNFSLSANYSDTKRSPSFNEQFYSSLYNIKTLKNEEFNTWDVSVEYAFNFFGNFNLTASYFDLIAKNKIVWVPTRQALQVPKNYGHIRYQGAEFQLTSSFLQNSLGLNIIYTYTNAINKSLLFFNDNTYNKQLIYTPKEKLNLNISFNYKNFSLSIYNSFVGERYYTGDNDPHNRLPAYYNCDLASTISFNLFEFNNNITVSVTNLFNEKYFVIQSYPMPLQTFTLTYILEII